jgi:hypothetical protein
MTPTAMETRYVHQLQPVVREYTRRDRALLVGMWVALFGLLAWLLGSVSVLHHVAR